MTAQPPLGALELVSVQSTLVCRVSFCHAPFERRHAPSLLAIIPKFGLLMISRLAKGVPVPAQLMVINLMLTLCTFTSGVMLARSLGAAGRGEYGALFTWALTVANISVWGCQVRLARLAAQDPDAAGGIYRTAYRIALISGLGGAGIYILVGLLSTAAANSAHFTPTMIMLASLIIVFSVPNAFQIQIELGRARFASYNVVRVLFALANFVSIGALWLSGTRSLFAFMLALVITTLIASLSAMLSIKGSLKGKTSNPAPGILQTYRSSAAVGLSIFFTALGQQADKLLVSILFPPAILGIYFVAAMVSQVQSTVGEALSQMFFTRAAAVKHVDLIDRQWFSMRLRQTILIYLVVCAGAMLVVPPIIPFVYGATFKASGALLFLLLPALAFQGMSRPFEETLRGLDYPHALLAQVACTVTILLLAAIAGRATESIMLFSAGTALAFLAGLIVAAHFLARRLNVPLQLLILPRRSDALGLWSAGSGMFRRLARSDNTGA